MVVWGKLPKQLLCRAGAVQQFCHQRDFPITLDCMIGSNPVGHITLTFDNASRLCVQDGAPGEVSNRGSGHSVGSVGHTLS